MLKVKNTEFYANHLEQVSRSFSFCISRLEGDFKNWVGLSYLIFRVLDTIEDAAWESRELQNQSFLDFNQFIFELPSIETWKTWRDRFPTDIPAKEQQLLVDSHILFSHLLELPLTTREKIQSSILNMSRGMMHFQNQKKTREGFQLKSLSEVNTYCFFVAGVVGELLTELLQIQMRNRNQEFEPTLKVYKYAIQFGLFLQKINILKDQFADEKEGRHLVPSRKALLSSLKEDAAGAFNYLCSIPKTEKPYRLFCGWSLFIGLESLKWIEKGWALKLFEKIPRAITTEILVDIEEIILDREALTKRFLELNKLIPFTLAPLVNNSFDRISKEQFSRLYLGRLDFLELHVDGVL